MSGIKKIALRDHYLWFVTGYFLLQWVIRLLFTDTLEIDEAEQMLLTQHFLWRYNQQPPLYTWITILFIKVFESAMGSVITIRFIVLWGIYYLTYLIAKRYFKNRIFVILSSLGMVLFPQLSVEGLRQTHTILVTFSVLLLLYSILQIAKKPSLRNYVFLGGTLALGMLSKHNFAIVIFGIFIALC